MTALAFCTLDGLLHGAPERDRLVALLEGLGLVPRIHGLVDGHWRTVLDKSLPVYWEATRPGPLPAPVAALAAFPALSYAWNSPTATGWRYWHVEHHPDSTTRLHDQPGQQHDPCPSLARVARLHSHHARAGDAGGRVLPPALADALTAKGRFVDAQGMVWCARCKGGCGYCDATTLAIPLAAFANTVPTLTAHERLRILHEVP